MDLIHYVYGHSPHDRRRRGLPIEIATIPPADLELTIAEARRLGFHALIVRDVPLPMHRYRPGNTL